jgi:hypothetical protein
MSQEKRKEENVDPTLTIKYEQQMLAEAYQGIDEKPLTAYDIIRIENEYWASRREAIDEGIRALRQRGRKTPHEI